MPKIRKRTLQPTEMKRQPKGRIPALLVEHLLRVDVRAATAHDPKAIAEELGLQYSSVTLHLRGLLDEGLIFQAYTVDPYATRFGSEYRLEIRLNPMRVSHWWRKRLKKTSKVPRDVVPGQPGPQEEFVREVVAQIAADPNYRKNIIVPDAVIVHGPREWDLELRVLTADGPYSIGHYVRNILALDDRVHRVTTITVGWRLALNGYPGKHLSHQDPKGIKKATAT